MTNKHYKIVTMICKTVVWIGIIILFIIIHNEHKHKQHVYNNSLGAYKFSIYNKEKEIQQDEWKDLINAIAFVESTNNPKARNGQSVGLLQITPIYVAECNRILGEDKYTLADREDSLKSIEMFKIYTQYHADVQDIEKTIHVHNPRGGQKYVNKVLKQLNNK